MFTSTFGEFNILSEGPAIKQNIWYFDVIISNGSESSNPSHENGLSGFAFEPAMF